MMKHAKIWIALSVTVALVGCKPGGGGSTPTTTKIKEAAPTAKVVEGMDTNLFPLKVGNQWTYSVAQTLARGGQVRNGSMEVTFRVKTVDRGANAVKATLEVLSGNKVSDRQIWMIDKTGIYQTAIGMNLVPFSSPQPVLKFPVKDGSEFRWSGSAPLPGGKSRNYSIVATVHSEQPVDTDMGPFKAVALESRATVHEGKNNGQEATSTWFTPNVGIVRLLTASMAGNVQQRNLLKLKSYSLK